MSWRRTGAYSARAYWAPTAASSPTSCLQQSPHCSRRLNPPKKPPAIKHYCSLMSPPPAHSSSVGVYLSTTDTTTVRRRAPGPVGRLATSPMPSLSKLFAGRARVADLTTGPVLELRTEAVLSSAAPS